MNPEKREREVMHATLLYIDERMEDGEVLRWAAQLRSHQEAERGAVRRALEFRQTPVAEPYRSAWRCVLELWGRPLVDADMKTIEIAQMVLEGLDPVWLLDEIVGVVAPQLTIEDDWALRPAVMRRRRRTVSDLLSLRLGASGGIVGLANLGIDPDQHVAVLPELADRLEAELVKGLHTASRVSEGMVWSANWIARVYTPAPRNDLAEDPEDDDPDLFRHGFVPLVRLLGEVLTALAARDIAAARSRVGRLKRFDFPLPRRLWAALARDPRLASGAEVGEWLVGLSDREFWRSWDFPEMAELRARRVSDLSARHRELVEARLRRRPPARVYPRSVEPERREELRDQATADELRRLTAAGAELARASVSWLETHGELTRVAVNEVEHGLYETFRHAPLFEDAPSPYPERGTALVKRLNAELAPPLYSGKARQAMDFVTVNADLVFDTVAAEPRGEDFPRAWAALAAAASEHVSSDANAPAEFRFGRERSGEFLEALSGLAPGALDTALDGVIRWMERSGLAFRGDPRFEKLWLTLWPAAAEETNRTEKDAGLEGASDDEKLAIASISSPAGRLMTALRNLLPNLEATPAPFAAPGLAAMRAAGMAAKGLARRHVLYQLLSLLPYLRRADRDWTNRELIPGLMAATGADVGLWDAISRIAVLPPDTMAIIGPSMAEAATGSALPDKIRARLAERLTLATLRALMADLPSPCPHAAVQQMLRRGGDAVRIRSAGALGRFVPGTAASTDGYERAVRPFLRTVWPMDRAAMSPALAEALAQLPARVGGDAFALAAEDIASLLMPFDAWSIWAYGLYERGAGAKTLLFPRTAEQARALLSLFDLTIADADGAVTPRDLSVALEPMLELVPELARDKRFLRLSSLARRN